MIKHTLVLVPLKKKNPLSYEFSCFAGHTGREFQPEKRVTAQPISSARRPPAPGSSCVTAKRQKTAVGSTTSQPIGPSHPSTSTLASIRFIPLSSLFSLKSQPHELSASVSFAFHLSLPNPKPKPSQNPSLPPSQCRTSFPPPPPRPSPAPPMALSAALRLPLPRLLWGPTGSLLAAAAAASRRRAAVVAVPAVRFLSSSSSSSDGSRSVQPLRAGRDERAAAGEGGAAVKERVVPVELHKEATEAYMAYAMSVLLGRALPDVRDGLKPVHRRIL